MRSLLAVLALMFLPISQEHKPASAKAFEVPVCDVVHEPASYLGKRLALQGIVIGEHTDRLILMYPECQFGVPLTFSADVTTHADVQGLFRAVRRGNPGTTDRDISGKFTGLLTSTPDVPYLLEVEKIEGLKFPKE